MSHSLRIRPLAQSDMTDAAIWYEGQQEDLGHAFLDETDIALEKVQERPLQFRRLQGGVRKALLHRFPYTIYFIVEEHEIVVIAVLHQHRDPSVWLQRLGE